MLVYCRKADRTADVGAGSSFTRYAIAFSWRGRESWMVRDLCRFVDGVEKLIEKFGFNACETAAL